MDDTMTRLLAGDALTPMEAAVFGAEFARGRWRGDPPVTARRVAFGESCLAVDSLNAALAEAGASATVAPVAEPAPAEDPMPHLDFLGPSRFRRKIADEGVWGGVNWLVDAGRDGDGVRLMIWCPYHPEGEPIAAVHDVTAWRTGDAQRVAEDLLHAALRRALATRTGGTDNAKETDHA